jgi:mannose-6-phosphate isomerase-like protein (cupin superfamily)
MAAKTRRRLLVTGHDDRGRSRVASDSIIEGHEVPGRPGMELNIIWGGDAAMRYPDVGAKPGFETFFPPVDGFRMIEMYMPGKTFNEAGRPQETDDHAVVRDDKRPGMHRSATIDMGYMVEGRIVLQLDEGEVTISAGDVIVQSGTIHAWYNPFDEPARFIGAMVGAHIEENE